jgi:8-oxo-dGTP diphosphatase
MNRWLYCPRCGEQLVERMHGDRPRPSCACGFVHWGNPVPAAAVILLRGEEMLWVRRAGEPRKGQWSLPSGFQEYDEDIAACALRELSEETGLVTELDSLLGVYSAFDDPRHNALLVVYTARYIGGEARAGDDADALAWFPIGSPPPDLAWETHRRALADLRRSRGLD